MNASRCLLISLCVAIVVFIAPRVKADFILGEPVNPETVMPGLDLAQEDGIDCFSSDGLEMYITSNRPGGSGDWDLWVLARASKDEAWGAPVNLGPAVNSPKEDSLCFLSSDGLTLYFGSNRPGGYGSYDIYVTTRPTRNSPWGQAVNIGPRINSSAVDGEPWISPDGLELYFESYRSGGYGSSDIYVARRATASDAWGDPVNLGPVVNGAYSEQWLSLSPDGLLLLFNDHPNASSFRPGGYGNSDMWMTRRASISDPWQPPVNLGPIANSPAHDGEPRICPDGRTLYFMSNRGSNWNSYQAPIVPVVDFTGDGQVDQGDMRTMVASWDQEDPLCDIGPYAWGDGIVDIEDLKVLADYLGKDLEDTTLLAHWPLNEAEGHYAHDDAGGANAMLVGNPVWQPEGGKVQGALQFDGAGDFLMATAVSGLGKGAFSAIAWVKGGAPGQVVLCHGQTSDWLYLDSSSGTLATDLQGSGPDVPPLVSDAVITDGQWHRIALVWDGADRILFADGREAARDALPQATVPDGGFLIGVGKASGTFWSGMIDDIRIYNRVVKP